MWNSKIQELTLGWARKGTEEIHKFFLCKNLPKPATLRTGKEMGS
jgi:hypothetical protein